MHSTPQMRFGRDWRVDSIYFGVMNAFIVGLILYFRRADRRSGKPESGLFGMK